ncbi:unnamed protein product [Closterium sp. NIES-53]
MLGDVHYYLGLQIERDVERRWLKVHQSHYISGVMERYGVTGGRTVMTPFPAGFKLKKAAEEDDVLEDEQRNEYQSLIGSVMYAAVHTQPDASFGVEQLARVVQRPTEEQLEVAKRLVRCLGSTASAGVQFSAGGQLKQIGADGVTPGTLKLSCFTDATWASEDEDHSSVGGFVCMVGGGPVSWRSKKQSEIAQSSGEAEYMAMCHAIKEIVLLRKLLEDMGAEQEGPTPLFSDSEAAIGMANNPILNGLNKHMKIKWHWVRQMVKEGIVELHHVKASKQAADFLTKRLPESAHWKCAKMCGMALHYCGQLDLAYTALDREVGDALVFRVWGSCTFVRDTSADKLSSRAIPCVFLGFPPNAPGWQFYHPTSRRVLPSQDVMFDESVPFYHLFPYRSAPLPPLPLFLAPGTAQGAASGGAASEGAGPARAEPGGAEREGAGSGGAEPGGAGPRDAEPEGAEPEGAESEGAEFGGAEPERIELAGTWSTGGPFIVTIGLNVPKTKDRVH